ncbi:MAG TPA: glutathione S-transferase N-terminal domain-containing protein [Solirubrobacterales bacterium]|jgi:glutathione S-transferase|nr:glutathione S-transferase N-terminal domain-containing protein [Solirubrobacterales bacterium]
MAEAKLYVIPGSHPSTTAKLILERKGIPYKRVDLIPVVSKGVVRAQGFPGVTVPALKIEGDKVQGSREIARALDRLRPEPPLFPADAGERVKVEEAERWGDEVLQAKPRRLTWWALKRNRAPMATYSEGAKLGVPVGLAVKTGGPIVALSARFNGATDERVRSDLAALPADLDKIDAWIEEGVLGGALLNAADLQIAPSIRLLMSFEDLRPAIEKRPAGELAVRAVPDFPGRTPPVIPPQWLPGLAKEA